MIMEELNSSFHRGGKCSTTDSIATADLESNFIIENSPEDSLAQSVVTEQLSQTFNCHQRVPNIRKRKDLYKMESLVIRMQATNDGVPIRTVQSFMSKVQSVFTGASMIEWVHKNLKTIDLEEAIHLCRMISGHGYVFPIDDHILTVKNDGTYYRFQTKCFWLSRCNEPDNTDYAVYLCKRTMQNNHRLELADYEAENLARLQKMFARKWEFIFLQAEAQVKVDKKREKQEKKILDSQERAFWDLHRPAPGCINTTEVDIKKACRMETQGSSHIIQGCPSTRGSKKDSLNGQIKFLKQQIDRRRQKVSKIAESLKCYWDMYAAFDPMITQPDPSNPWITDSTEFWESETSTDVVSKRRYKRWVFSIFELLRDTAGLDEFRKFLHKEFSAENLEFWLACRHLKSLPLKSVRGKVLEIFQSYCAEGARYPINIDSKVNETVKENVLHNPNRYSFDAAEEQIFNLMRNDSYTRYIRSDLYKDYASNQKKTRVTNKISLFNSKPMQILTNSSASNS